MTTVAPNSQEVRSLIGHSHVDLALTCLGSLLSRTRDPLHLVLHDDGSLTEQDEERLHLGLGGAMVLRRPEADDRAEEMLREYPHALKYRREDVFGLKLLDTALFASGNIAYCDTDIYFFRPFCELFKFPNPETSALFMMDLQNAYSMPARDLWKTKEARLPRQVNAGIFFCRRSTFDLDFIEWFLQQPRFLSVRHWVEQTCWAMLGFRAGCRLWDPRQIWMVNSRQQPPMGMVAGHFVQPVRQTLQELIAQYGLATTSPAVTLHTLTVRPCGPLRLLLHQLRNQIGRWRDTRKLARLRRRT
jgi:hypothetical protein